jgi:hypothetical protein
MLLLAYLVCLVAAGAVIRYFFPCAHLLRVPLVCGTVFALFPYLATDGPLRAFGRGMFEVMRWDIWQVAFVVLITAAALLTCTDLIVSHAGERMPGTRRLPDYLGREIVTRPVRLSVLSFGLGVLYFAGAIFYLAKLQPMDGWGARAALELLLSALLFAASLGALRILARSETLRQAVTGVVVWLETPEGYINPATGRVYPAHALAAALAAVSVLAYLLFGYVRYAVIHANAVIGVEEAEVASTVPTLAWVVFLVLLLCWILSGLTFLMDRRRIPLFLPLGVLFGLCAYFFPRSDHVFPVVEHKFDPAPPGELVNALPPGADPNAVIVVAASGGGIQAAAWTAAVVEGLVKAFPGTFARQVRLLSGVSGGSVGLMYCAAAYRDGDIPHGELSRAVLGSGEEADPLFRLASAASLDYAAWGLAFPDFFRSWIPILFPQHVDRAWALSRAWVRYRGMEPLREVTLGRWAEDARAGRRPPVVFNATLAETGARYLLSTFRPEVRLIGRRDFASDLAGRDILAATAARLSAAFPYVSPAARPDADCGEAPCGHIVDGGYYDNYGVASSIDFLLEALPEAKGKRVLLLHIEAGRFGEAAVTKTQRGWFYQVLAPPQGLLGVWDTAMRSRNEVDLAMIKEVIASRGGLFESLRVDFPEPEPPLSWRLTREEKEQIRKAWRDDRAPEIIPAVRKFLEDKAR